MSTHEIEQETPLSSVVAGNIRAAAAYRRWSQGKMALAVGMSRVAINDRFNGKTAWTLDEMQRAAHALGVPLSELVRHQGLEPRTRWFGAPRRSLRLILGGRGSAEAQPIHHPACPTRQGGTSCIGCAA